MNMTLEEIHRILIGNHFTRLDHVFDESSVDIDKHREVFKHQLINALAIPHQLTVALELIYYYLRVPADSIRQ